MKTIKYPDKEKSLKKAMKALYKELGPAEMVRVTAMGHENHEDSVKTHRKLQESVSAEECIREIMAAYTKE
ncbi:MAG: hypothetical protein GF350_09545 [Chitinivibrionales bacterium]|nr:hypothetical protein [Chitinivibrionales bacterium]